MHSALLHAALRHAGFSTVETEVEVVPEQMMEQNYESGEEWPVRLKGTSPKERQAANDGSQSLNAGSRRSVMVQIQNSDGQPIQRIGLNVVRKSFDSRCRSWRGGRSGRGGRGGKDASSVNRGSSVGGKFGLDTAKLHAEPHFVYTVDLTMLPSSANKDALSVVGTTERHGGVTGSSKDHVGGSDYGKGRTRDMQRRAFSRGVVLRRKAGLVEPLDPALLEAEFGAMHRLRTIATSAPPSPVTFEGTPPWPSSMNGGIAAVGTTAKLGECDSAFHNAVAEDDFASYISQPPTDVIIVGAGPAGARVSVLLYPRLVHILT